MGFFIIKTFFLELLFYYNKSIIFVHINNLKYKKMIELIVGGFIYYMINTIDKERKVLKRVKDANKELFSDDRIKYINI